MFCRKTFVICFLLRALMNMRPPGQRAWLQGDDLYSVWFPPLPPQRSVSSHQFCWAEAEASAGATEPEDGGGESGCAHQDLCPAALWHDRQFGQHRISFLEKHIVHFTSYMGFDSQTFSRSVHLHTRHHGLKSIGFGWRKFSPLWNPCEKVQL